MEAARYLRKVILIDIVLIAVYLVLYFFVFREPSYVPFASGGLSTLVPEGSHRQTNEGAWETHEFGGKGSLVIAKRNVRSSELGDLIRRNRDAAAAGEDVSLREMVRRSMGDKPEDAAPSEPADLSEMVKQAREDSTGLGVSGRADDSTSSMRIEAGRTYLQLLASNTPNLRVMEEVPAFDSTIFCLGSVGRGERRYRYLVHSGDVVVDLYMHSRHSSHLVYKEVLDVALQNLRIDGESSNHILELATSDISDRISPRWSQGSIFWLLFMLVLPTGIMLILMPVSIMRARRQAGSASNPP